MDSASENEDLGGSFLSDGGAQYLVTDDDSRGDDDEDSDRTGVLREQDRFLPIANVARLMKKSIPKTGKIAKDARECVQECVSEFVSFITSEASERCHQEKRKTINGEDILFAMQSLGFDNYIEPLKIYLQKYRESLKGEKSLLLADGDLLLMGGGEKDDLLSPAPSPPEKPAPSSKDDDLSIFYAAANHPAFTID